MIETTLPEQLVAGAMQHMNEDHQHNLLDYAKVLAGCDWAETAVMTALNATGFELDVQGNGRQEQHLIKFPEPVTDSKGLRMTLVQMAQDTQIGDEKTGVALTSQANVPTAKAERYLKALVNHFNRKVEGAYEGNKGHVQFPFGDCWFEATEKALLLQVTSESIAMRERTKHVVADHLVRFANKEELVVEWQDQY